jgi:hypothetical protein
MNPLNKTCTCNLQIQNNINIKLSIYSGKSVKKTSDPNTFHNRNIGIFHHSYYFGKKISRLVTFKKNLVTIQSRFCLGYTPDFQESN